jgi:hypothetical protein
MTGMPGRILHFTCRDLANMVYGLALLQHRDAVPALCAAGMGKGGGRGEGKLDGNPDKIHGFS